MGSHQRRGTQSRPFDNASSVGRCGDCGKLSFLSKAAAKKNGRQSQSNGIDVTRAYRCGSGYWHLTSQDAETVAAHRERA